MNEYEARLLYVRRGLMWMMAGYVWIAGTFVCGAVLMSGMFFLLTSDFERQILDGCAAIGAIVCGLVFLGMQFQAAWYCWQCPEEAVRRGRTWIFASGVFYGMFFGAVLGMMFLNTQFAWRLLGNDTDLLEIILGWIAVWSFGISGWFWQYFLLELARGIKSGVGTAVGWGVISLFSVAGFCTMFVFGVWVPYDMYVPHLDEAVIGTAMISGFGFMGLYACLMAGLWWRMGSR